MKKVLISFMIIVMCVFLTPTYAIGPGYLLNGISIGISILGIIVPFVNFIDFENKRVVAIPCFKIQTITQEDGAQVTIETAGQKFECSSGGNTTCTPEPCNI